MPLYLEKSAVKRPLLIADLKEEYIDALLRQEQITEIKKTVVLSGATLTTKIWQPFIIQPSLSSTPRCARVSASLWWKPWLAALPSLQATLSAMPEVAGEGAVLINPEQPQQIADALIKLENDADFYQKQVDYGLERVKLFSWRNTAEAYSKIYREIQKKQSLET